jgi:unsaturated chondroitin disaccharide hydrolase
MLAFIVGLALQTQGPLLLRGDEMAKARKEIAPGQSLRPAYEQLLHDADSALKHPIFTVTAKHRTPPSGDKHDYMSLAPYWWPDSTKPGGVPFIRRDGDVNPESRLDTDSPRFLQFADAVETLTLAYYFSNDPKYARRAGVLLRAWFLDGATKMNPNLRFAQAIPGVTEGRGIGIIDTRNLTNIVDDVLLLRGAPGWTAADERGIREWARQYVGWLQTSPQGREEAIQKNNHGTWYDAQLASLALFVGDTALARRVISDAGPGRIARQIAPDGRMPEELARTRPIHYTLFNLEPFARLAELGRHVGVDLWNYKGPNGAGLKQATLFVAPYLDSAVKWTGREIVPARPEEFVRTIRQAALAYHDAAIDAALHRMPAGALEDDRSALLYPSTTDDVSRVIRRAAERYKFAATTLDPANGYPRSSRPDGTWELNPARTWTSGFFAGSLWRLYGLTHDTAFRTLARKWTNGLEPNASRTDTHDLGFLINDSFGEAYRATHTPHDSAVVIAASRSLASRFSAKVGAIKSWDIGPSDARPKWAFPVIIDNMMNLEMLFWSASHGGDPAWKRIAERHALTTARSHVRDDGSVVHVVNFDPATGKLLARTTWQGYADTSAWARGQAWAIYGFTQAYQETKNPRLLRTARRVADWWLAHVPADGVPPWDFRAPGAPNVEKDVSAAAIAACGLLDLSRVVGGSEGSAYRAAADRTLTSLARNYVDNGAKMALLSHSVGSKPQASEVDVDLVYADYYFLQALSTLSS